MMKTQGENRAHECAQGCLETIKQLVKAYSQAGEREDDNELEKAKKAIQESHYGILVRSDWVIPSEKMEAGEYIITLAGGGPAVRIRGTLDEIGDPDTALLEYQDWFESLTEYLDLTSEDRQALLEYAWRM